MEQLRQALCDGTSQLCCFHDVEVENVVFEENGDPSKAILRATDHTPRILDGANSTCTHTGNSDSADVSINLALHSRQ